jgi:hypothetical protein
MMDKARYFGHHLFLTIRAYTPKTFKRTFACQPLPDLEQRPAAQLHTLRDGKPPPPGLSFASEKILAPGVFTPAP